MTSGVQTGSGLVDPADQPRVSVVIPTYNRAATIDYCIRSVLAQSVSPLEVLIVDDGSTDHTVQIAQSTGDGRVRVLVAQRNRGAQAARNMGIRAARGNWIAFLDSDDTWVPAKMERQLDRLRDLGCDCKVVIYSDVYRYYSSTGQREHWHLRHVQGDDSYHALLRGPAPLLQAMLVSRIALEEIGLLDEAAPAYQEWDTAIRLARAGGRFVHMPEPLVDYHLGHGGTISGDGRRGILGYQYILDKFRAEIAAEVGAGAWRDHLEIQLRHSLNGGFWDLAAGYLEQLRENPPRRWWLLQLYASLHIRPVSVARARATLTGSRSKSGGVRVTTTTSGQL